MFSRKGLALNNSSRTTLRICSNCTTTDSHITNELFPVNETHTTGIPMHCAVCETCCCTSCADRTSSLRSLEDIPKHLWRTADNQSLSRKLSQLNQSLLSQYDVAAAFSDDPAFRYYSGVLQNVLLSPRGLINFTPPEPNMNINTDLHAHDHKKAEEVHHNPVKNAADSFVTTDTTEDKTPTLQDCIATVDDILEDEGGYMSDNHDNEPVQIMHYQSETFSDQSDVYPVFPTSLHSPTPTPFSTISARSNPNVLATKETTDKLHSMSKDYAELMQTTETGDNSQTDFIPSSKVLEAMFQEELNGYELNTSESYNHISNSKDNGNRLQLDQIDFELNDSDWEHLSERDD